MTGDGDEAAAERDRIASKYWGTPNVKEEFQEYVWGLLRRQKDFNVGPKNESRDMSLGEIVDKWRENKDDDNLRVYASEDRRWRTLTGHGPDLKRVGFSSTAIRRGPYSDLSPGAKRRFQVSRGDWETP